MNYHGRNFVTASLVVALGFLAVPASAGTRIVDQDGQATPTNCSASKAAYVSIGAAVAAAADGDNAVSSNRIQETPVGIWDYSGTGNTHPTVGGSTFFNVDTLAVTGAPLARHSFVAAGGARVRTAVRP